VYCVHPQLSNDCSGTTSIYVACLPSRHLPARPVVTLLDCPKPLPTLRQQACVRLSSMGLIELIQTVHAL
jgi:hypothetical protein